MSAPRHEPAPIGSRDECLDLIGEYLSLARIQCGLGVTYSEIDDVAGLEYAVRRGTAYQKAALAILADLKAKSGGSS